MAAERSPNGCASALKASSRRAYLADVAAPSRRRFELSDDQRCPAPSAAESEAIGSGLVADLTTPTSRTPPGRSSRVTA